MAYDFLGLVNDINKKVNEVQLTSVNFASAIGFYDDAKTSVNNALQELNSVAWEWPFNHVTKELELIINQVRYDYEANTKSINWKTFRIKGDDALQVNTTPLFDIDYEDYLEKFSDMEYRPTRYSNIPKSVFRTPELKFGIIPPPNKLYTLFYEYYGIPAPLEDYDDVPTVPEFYRHVINYGSYEHAYAFRGDLEMSEKYAQKFKSGIEFMRSIFVNRTEYMRSAYRR